MAIIYYPIGSQIYSRNSVSSSYQQLALSVSPNTILYFDTSSTLNSLSASQFYITASNSISSSYSYTASYFGGSVFNSTSASYALTASYAMNGGGGSNVSASYAQSSSFLINEGYSAPTFYNTASLWTVVNLQGVVVYPSHTIRRFPRNAVYKPQHGADNNMTLFVKSIPATPYTITMGVQPSYIRPANYTRCGITIYDGSAKLIIFVITYDNNQWKFVINKFANVTTYNGTYVQLFLGSTENYTTIPVLLALRDDGTNFTFLYSLDDGTTWQQLYQVSRTDFLTPSQAGLVVDASNSTDMWYAIYHYSETLSVSQVTP